MIHIIGTTTSTMKSSVIFHMCWSKKKKNKNKKKKEKMGFFYF